MLIVDSQVHIWSQGLPGNKAHRQITSYSVDDLLSEMDEGCLLYTSDAADE